MKRPGQRTNRTSGGARRRLLGPLSSAFCPLPSAFTLVEAALSTVIVAGVLGASLMTLGAVARSRRTQADRQQGVALAHSLMAEVLQCYYQDPAGTGSLAPPAGATRATFNGVEDYAGYSESPPTLKSGAALAGCTAWTRSVQVNWVLASDGSTVSSTETGLKRITVTVVSPSGLKTTLSGLRSRFDPYEQTPLQSTRYLLWTGLDVQVGPNGKTVHPAAHPMNETTSQ